MQRLVLAVGAALVLASPLALTGCDGAFSPAPAATPRPALLPLAVGNR